VNGDTVPQRKDRLDALWPRPGPVIMGVVNCTPDSFSDGGRFLEHAVALAHAEEMVADGARIIDVGGESTRPGAEPVSATTEGQRVLEVIRRLRSRHADLVISIDTTKAEVAAAALEAGADVVNDVTGGHAPGMLEVVAESGAALIIMHMRGTPRTMQADTSYRHVVAEVHQYLAERACAAAAAGIDAARTWLDPGIGFGKDDAGNISLLAALPDLASLGFPVVLGASRKSFIGRLTGAEVGHRLAGSLAAMIPALGLPRVVCRVHEPRPAAQFLAIAGRLLEATA
jgi:dihydropteroate synthase